MPFEPRLDIIGAALADPSRARIVCELMDGRSHTGKELASVAGVAPNTASDHLSRLLDAGMICAQRSGRFVYYRIASDEVGEVLERMSWLSPTDHLYRGSKRRQAPELLARSCYNHIAGRLGVLIAESLISAGCIRETDSGVRLTQVGCEKLVEIELVSAEAAPPAAKCCLDWSERRRHLSGPLGTAILDNALARKWLSRPRTGRALHIEEKGFAAFERHFGIAKSALLAPGDPA